jgi:hypothetical protein
MFPFFRKRERGKNVDGRDCANKTVVADCSCIADFSCYNVYYSGYSVATLPSSLIWNSEFVMQDHSSSKSHQEQKTTRRDVLKSAAAGLGILACAGGQTCFAQQRGGGYGRGGGVGGSISSSSKHEPTIIFVFFR